MEKEICILEIHYICGVSLTPKPFRLVRRGMYIHKGVTERFGFDDSRISQILNSLSRTKQRERPVGCLYTALIVSCRFIAIGTMSGRLYNHIGVGLSTLLVSTNWACESL